MVLLGEKFDYSKVELTEQQKRVARCRAKSFLALPPMAKYHVTILPKANSSQTSKNQFSPEKKTNNGHYFPGQTKEGQSSPGQDKKKRIIKLKKPN
ncbi:hypothetical protein E2C01_073060 [Portunus trituberculatus]|uniref:Uncharacterized protein n=1 Tax=Portunus trituberculatus TaxID=210409 RepID=A0A5B7HZS5_PORTR|nr:hypothetical protein [Portunus trituberculatus]